MASPFSMHSLAGFYKAPVTKGLISAMVAGTCVIHLPPTTIQNIGLAPYVTATQMQIARIIMQRLFFWNIKDLMCGCLLLYYFRIFERRYGSRKYASMLLANLIISQLLHSSLACAAHHLSYNLGPVPNGPYGMVLSPFPAYFSEIPAVAYTEIFNIFPVTGKTLTYLIALQMVAPSGSIIIAALCAALSSHLYAANVLYVRSWLCVPRWLARLSSTSLGWLLASDPPTDDHVPMGATLELQRQQQLEQLELSMLRRGGGGRGRGEVVVGNVNVTGHGGSSEGWFWTRRRRRAGQEGTGRPSPPTQENITRLVEMGFSDGDVRNALQQSNNDVTLATNILLQQGQH